jgi:hypothetical protein
MRALNPAGAVRAGVDGNWSTTNSTTASAVKITAVIIDDIKCIGVPIRLNHPRRAAHDVTAGPVNDRNPVTTPIRNTNKSTCG